jgi:ABC-2 type transport system ATP-binding protein
VALIGANGSGKSTAVRSICGLLEPTEGTVRICDADPHTEPGATAARAALAFVPDQPVLYDELTVHQHLELTALSHGAAEGLADRIAGLLDRLGLTARKDFLPAELSRGMRQKTQLACAFVRPARLIVLDEPVVGLDPPSQTLLATMLGEAKAAGSAVLFTTHQLRFAEGLADRAVRLDEGTIADAGAWEAVRERAADAGWSTT